MVPPPGDLRVPVDRARSAAGVVFLRKGHTALDWLKRASMMVCVSVGKVSRSGVVGGGRSVRAGNASYKDKFTF